jgi:hypothetical protein
MTQGRDVERAPDLVRARLLARARSIITAPAALAEHAGVCAPRGWPWLQVALAAMGVAFAAVGAGAVVRALTPRPSGIDPANPEPAMSPAPAPRQQSPSETPRSGSAPAARRLHPRRSPSAQESYAAELELLQRAQSDYARHEFFDALVLVAEHARRFPNGRLAEEAEALRVRSLVRVGRAEEARHALEAFTARFPRSVLLHRLEYATSGAG